MGASGIKGLASRAKIARSVNWPDSQHHDNAGWSNVVQSMVARGATGTNAEVERMIEYLIARFGP
ncbi:MAG TPA: hypothetical protein VHZ07_13315 [Bryobacteraceae bacterium]|jgi:hypothetical protein|nr:hypothetical protein [Bryobacteraceae bacterium]